MQGCDGAVEGVTDVRRHWLLASGFASGAVALVVFGYPPFQLSASGGAARGTWTRYAPAEVQAILELHASPFRLAPLAPVGLAVCWIVHLVPFQRSANY